jgi:hypothetical protein
VTTFALDDRRTPPVKHQNGRRIALLALEIFTAVMAVAGAVYGLAGAENVPREWLEGTPFDTYLVPSLILLIAVGGDMALAAVSVIARHSRAGELSMGAGFVLVTWIVAQVGDPVQLAAAAVLRAGLRRGRTRVVAATRTRALTQGLSLSQEPFS